MADNENENGKLPGDIDLIRQWLPIARRLRQIADSAHSPAVVRLSVVVDETGTPRLYSVHSTRLEPRANFDSVVDWLAGLDDLTH